MGHIPIYSHVLKAFPFLSTPHVHKSRIYLYLLPLSQKLTKTQLQFAGYCQRAMGEITQSLLLWKPSGPIHSRRLTFPDMIARDSGIERSDLGNATVDREVCVGPDLERRTMMMVMAHWRGSSAFLYNALTFRREFILK